MTTVKKIIFGILFIAQSIALYFFYQAKAPKNSLFPIEVYDQEISHWILPSTPGLDKPLLTPSQIEFRRSDWYSRYFGENSPWNSAYVLRVLSESAPQDLQTVTLGKLEIYNNETQTADKIGYGANFRPHSKAWFEKVRQNVNGVKLISKNFDPEQRGIMVLNATGRVIPTDEPFFFHHEIAGEGYPFDNAEAAVVWAGTPVYTLAETLDGQWSLALTPSFTAWIPTSSIGKTNSTFVKNWLAASQKNLVAIIKTGIEIRDSQENFFRFSGFIGMVFPGQNKLDKIEIDIPVLDASHRAQLRHVLITTEEGIHMPLEPTAQNFLTIIKNLKGRPYGWGGLYFYNDCASEIKNLFTPFQIWIPIHSSEQVNPDRFAVVKEDKTSLKPIQRIQSLFQKGHPFMTIVYIGGHVFLYLGNYPNPKTQQTQILTYQNIWALRPKKTLGSIDRRVVIGGSVLFPLLEVIPEDPSLVSLAAKKFFELGFLDGDPIRKQYPLDLKYLSSP